MHIKIGTCAGPGLKAALERLRPPDFGVCESKV